MAAARAHRHGILKSRYWPILIGAVVTFLALAPSAQSPTHTLLRGYIALAPSGGETAALVAVKAGHDVFLPGVMVSLRDAGNGQMSGPAVTDLSGRFTLAVNGPGRYQVCWKTRGFVDDCSKDIYSVAKQPVNIGTVRIRGARTKTTVPVIGKVLLKDGSPARFFEPMANINAYARIGVVDKGGKLLDEAYVNNFGEYALARVPVDQLVTLRAVIGKGVGEQRLDPGPQGANLQGASFHVIDLAIANSPPRLDPLVALDSAANRVKVAKPGAKLELVSRGTDPDGDTLRYTWLVDDGSGAVSAPSGPKATWALPNRAGLFTVTLIADDGKGGYVRSALSLRADNAGIPFSGRVVDVGGAAIGGAEIEINGQTAFTGTQGTFYVRVRDATQFVLNIRKQGFALNSNIYDNGVTGGRWLLTRASVSTVDPTKPIDLTQERSPRDCPGPVSATLDYKNYPKLAVPQYQDGKGNIVQPFKDSKLPPLFGPQNRSATAVAAKGCGPGIRVQIPANALVDETGHAPTGPVQVALSTVDLLSPQQMPGDFTVAVSATSTKVMDSYGAGSVEITAGAKHYNLRTGTKAQITIPVDRSQLAVNAPLAPTIPLLFYDARAGVWRQDGQMTLVNKAYVASVPHFSYINADTLKTDQACVRVLSPTLPPNYDMEAWIPQTGGAAPKVFNQPFDNSPPSLHVIFNLPVQTNIVLIPHRQIDHTPIGIFIVNTGQAQNPTTPNHPVAPYTACSTEVTLTDQGAVPQSPTAGEFLQGLFSFEATNLDELNLADPAQADLKQQIDQTTANYYLQVDPPKVNGQANTGRRQTLGDFKTFNGFGGLNELHGIYANSGDLGFGRDMHCVSKPASDGQTDYACYVTNYGNINTPDLQDAIDATNNSNPVATVAMEYSRLEDVGVDPPSFSNPTRVVKFFVYNGNLAGSTLLRAANLDATGARPIPQLCMVCHGGAYPVPPVGPPPVPGHLPVPGFNSPSDVNLSSRFLPFDLHYYTFAGGAPDKLAQQGAFKDMNQQIVAHAPVDAAIGDLITQMYAGGPNQDENLLVSGWQNAPGQPLKEQTYREVVARTCRTCHVANTFAPLNFDQAQEFIDRLGSIENRVCAQHVMPHSRVTHDIFWGVEINPPPPPVTPEGSKVALLQVFGDNFKTAQNGWNGQLCGVFIPGGQTPQSFYQTNILPIFTNNTTNPGGTCTNCHTGNSPPAQLNLSAALAHAQLVNIAAQELGSMKRVTPNNTAQSYLFHKVQGDQGAVGGSGGQMPAGQPQLTAGQRNDIQTWINGGAQP